VCRPNSARNLTHENDTRAFNPGRIRGKIGDFRQTRRERLPFGSAAATSSAVDPRAPRGAPSVARVGRPRHAVVHAGGGIEGLRVVGHRHSDGDLCEGRWAPTTDSPGNKGSCSSANERRRNRCHVGRFGRRPRVPAERHRPHPVGRCLSISNSRCLSISNSRVGMDRNGPRPLCPITALAHRAGLPAECPTALPGSASSGSSPGP
jgi:hypothetical protein